MRYFKVVSLLLLFQFLANVVVAQQNLIYNHYFMNPYVYNPSYIPSGYTELFMNYRKQWAEFNGSPNTATLNLQVPINYRMGFGVNLYNDRAGVLQTNTGMVSFAYQVYLGKSTNDLHRLGFGLAAGATMSRIDLSKVDDPSDPALVNNSTSSIDGQFGINYQFNNLKIGFSLPRLFVSNVVSEDGFNTPELDQLNNTISTISYNFTISPRVSVEPFFLYRTSEGVEGQYEVLGVVKLDNMMWGGASYRQHYGAAAFLGFTVKEKLRVGYAYEFAPSQVTGFGNGSHEIQIALRIGKKKRERPVAETTSQPEPVVAQEPEVEKPKTEDLQTKPEEKVEAVVVAPIVADQKPVVEEVHPVEAEIEPVRDKLTTLSGRGLKPGHYIVVGAFRSNQNALNYMNNLKQEGYPATVSYSEAKNYYLVHMGNQASLDEAKKLRDKYRVENKFTLRETWILTVEE
ncbi:MAG: PorP/SprF family type IX secretion system membrane protein [Cyclobacteriaceae bacterium]